VMKDKSAPSIWMEDKALYVLSLKQDSVSYSAATKAPMHYEFSDGAGTSYWIRRWQAYSPGATVQVKRGKRVLLERSL